MSDEKSTYEVGYKKPPKEHQFKKGRPSANPKGRRKKSRNFAVLFRETLGETVTITENGKEKRVTVQEAIVKRLFIDAMKGKTNAVERILNTYARHFRTEADLPRQAQKSIDTYLETLSVEELEKLIESYNKATQENKAKEKLRKQEERGSSSL